MTTSEFINALTAGFTALYLIVTFLILLAALKANRHGRENAATADRRTQEALAMTRESNDLTQQSIEIARRSLELSVRPALHIGSIVSNPTLQQFTFKVSISNKGGSAYDLAFLSGRVIRSKTETPVLDDLEDPLPVGGSSRGSLARDEKFEDSHTIEDWNSVYHQHLKNGDEILYFYATATYRDILNHRYRTRFLRQFDPAQHDWSVGMHDESEIKT
jgi:hypothetical protein